MGKYSEGQRTHLEGIGRAIEAAGSPRHKAILANYQQHVALEQAGKYEEIFSRGLIVPEPTYQVGRDGQEEIFSGADAVKGWYRSLLPYLATLLNEKLAVADWGFASWSDLIEWVPGAELESRSFKVDDPESLYMLTSNQVMFWLYNDEGLLLGERLYVVNQPNIELADPNDMLTKQTQYQQCVPYFEAAKLPA